MDIRFYSNPESELPHIWEHGVTEEEVREVLHKTRGSLRAEGNTLMKTGQTDAGRHIHVIFSSDKEGDGVFVITAYPVTGKA